MEIKNDSSGFYANPQSIAPSKKFRMTIFWSCIVLIGLVLIVQFKLKYSQEAVRQPGSVSSVYRVIGPGEGFQTTFGNVWQVVAPLNPNMVEIALLTKDVPSQICFDGNPNRIYTYPGNWGALTGVTYKYFHVRTIRPGAMGTVEVKFSNPILK